MKCKKCESFNITTYTLVNFGNTKTVETCHNCNNVEVKHTNVIDKTLLNII